LELSGTVAFATPELVCGADPSDMVFFFTMQVYQSTIFVTKYIIHIDLSRGFGFGGPCETSLVLFGGRICGNDGVVDGCPPAPDPSADWFRLILRTIGTQKDISTYRVAC